MTELEMYIPHLTLTLVLNFIKWNHLHPNSGVPYRINWGLIAVIHCSTVLPSAQSHLSTLSHPNKPYAHKFLPHSLFQKKKKNSNVKMPTCSQIQVSKSFLNFLHLPWSLQSCFSLPVLLSYTKKAKATRNGQALALSKDDLEGIAEDKLGRRQGSNLFSVNNCCFCHSTMVWLKCILWMMRDFFFLKMAESVTDPTPELSHHSASPLWGILWSTW